MRPGGSVVRLPCHADGIQLGRYADGAVVLQVLHPAHSALDDSSMNIHIPPDPPVAQLQQRQD